GAAAGEPPASAFQASAAANTRLPASISPRAGRAGEGSDSGGRASAATAMRCPNTCSAAVCSRPRARSPAPCAAYADSATPAAATSAPAAQSQRPRRVAGSTAVLTPTWPATQRAAPGGCGARHELSSAWRGLFPQPPEHLELAVLGERLVDAVLVVLERTVGDLVAMGHRPGAHRIAHVLQLGHEALVFASGDLARRGADVLDRRAVGDGDLQLAFVDRGRLGHGFGLVALVRGIGTVAAAVVGALAAHRLDHVEGVVLAAQF